MVGRLVGWLVGRWVGMLVSTSTKRFHKRQKIKIEMTTLATNFDAFEMAKDHEINFVIFLTQA